MRNLTMDDVKGPKRCIHCNEEVPPDHGAKGWVVVGGAPSALAVPLCPVGKKPWPTGRS